MAMLHGCPCLQLLQCRAGILPCPPAVFERLPLTPQTGATLRGKSRPSG